MLVDYIAVEKLYVNALVLFQFFYRSKPLWRSLVADLFKFFFFLLPVFRFAGCKTKIHHWYRWPEHKGFREARITSIDQWENGGTDWVCHQTHMFLLLFWSYYCRVIHHLFLVKASFKRQVVIHKNYYHPWHCLLSPIDSPNFFSSIQSSTEWSIVRICGLPSLKIMGSKSVRCWKNQNHFEKRNATPKRSIHLNRTRPRLLPQSKRMPCKMLLRIFVIFMVSSVSIILTDRWFCLPLEHGLTLRNIKSLARHHHSTERWDFHVLHPFPWIARAFFTDIITYPRHVSADVGI